MSQVTKLAAALLAAAAVSGCASGPGPAGSFAERDPYEQTNRAIHSFNLGADQFVLRPAAQGYRTATPALFQHMLGNVFDHFETVTDLANYMFQGDWDRAGTAAGRFYINTFIGAGGLLDPATEFGLPKESTDFGITLGKWGVGEGAFIMLPLFGPSTTRDVGGRIVDVGLDPTTYIFNGLDAIPTGMGLAYTATSGVEERAENFDLVDDILYNSEDSYISLRTVYLQRRDALILGSDADALPDIFDEEPSE